MKERAITLGVKELTFLAALLDGQTLLGVADPFDGWLAHQVEEEWAKLCPKMEANQLISRDENGKVVVDGNIAEIIRTCCFPDGCVLLSRWVENGNSTSGCYYLTRDIQVEKMDESTPEVCTLTVIDDPSAIQSLMKEYFSIDHFNSNESPGIEVPASFIESVRATKGEAHGEMLRQVQERYPAIKEPGQLIHAIVSPLSYTILIYSDFRKEPVGSYGFSVLEGQNCLWKFRSFNKHDEEWMEIKPLTKEGFNQELFNVSKRIKEITEDQ